MTQTSTKPALLNLQGCERRERRGGRQSKYLGVNELNTTGDWNRQS